MIGFYYGGGSYGSYSWVIFAFIAVTFVVRMTSGRRRRTNSTRQRYDQVPFNSPQPDQSSAVAQDSGGWGVARSGIPAGWLPDPTGRYEERYWSGAAWSEHVRTRGVPNTDPPPS